jgi:hypothetical protein
MRKRYGLLAIACGGLLAVTLLLLLTREREPVYQGRELSAWVHLWGLSDSDSISKRQAQEAIVALGTNNLDLLVRRISFEPTRSRTLGLTLRLPGPIRKVLLRPVVNRMATESRLARDALEAFYAMGPAGAPAAPRLAKIINSGDESSAMNALKALEATGEAALPTLGSIITNGTTSTQIRMRAIYHLKYHTDSPIVRNALTNALHDPDPEIRRHATNILSRGAFE